ncbi:hypothetical protein PHISCL_02834 [Aspergillus sclerotialis]|uniref:Uncharacterized protein n=1 Tax=Aspergillus sclerotialis TaxID=2070753 RepID=A0A3A2ZZL0_9EURO|nr:hypothetical protein PHISCL_02834 [Aspergillus sclerotialis]
MVLINALRVRRRPEDDTKYCEHAIDAVSFAPSAGRSRVRVVCLIMSDVRGLEVHGPNKSLRSSSQLGENIWQLEWDD